MTMIRNIKRPENQNGSPRFAEIDLTDMETKKLPSELLVTVNYQRDLEMPRVRDIEEEFDPYKVNNVKVSYRGGKYYVFDGSHTLAALKKLHGDEPFMVNCNVYHNLTYEKEAELFAHQDDNKRAVAFANKLNAHLCAKESAYVAFHDLTEKCGIKLSLDKTSGACTICALKKAWTIYEHRGAVNYEKTLRLINHTWNGVDWSFRAAMIGGVSAFLSKFPNFDETRFIQKLSVADWNSIKNGAAGLMRDQDTAFAVSIARLYNSRGGRHTVNVEMLLV